MRPLPICLALCALAPIASADVVYVVSNTSDVVNVINIPEVGAPPSWARSHTR